MNDTDNNNNREEKNIIVYPFSSTDIPENAARHYKEGASAEDRRDMYAAIECYSKALELCPGFIKAYVR